MGEFGGIMGENFKTNKRWEERKNPEEFLKNSEVSSSTLQITLEWAQRGV